MASYGDTFLFADDDDEQGHLHVIITQPSKDGQVVTVTVTTRHKKSDAMVPLEIGDHPYIKRPSVFTFAFARVKSLSTIDAVIANRDAKQCDPMDEKFLRRARSAIVESEFTPLEVLEFLRGLE
jgi:hypothetical protein